MNILGIDTSNAKKMLLALKTPTYTDARDIEVHSLEAEIIPQIDKLLQDNQLSLHNIDAFVLGQGPGSFMGLRIGFSVVRSWAWLGDKLLGTVSSLEILALSADFDSQTLIVPCVDAKMKKIFTAAFFAGRRLTLDVDVFPEVWADEIKRLGGKLAVKKIIVIGNGVEFLCNFLPNAFFFQQDAQAKALSELMSKKLKFCKPSENGLQHLEPQYLRLSAAEEALKTAHHGVPFGFPNHL